MRSNSPRFLPEEAMMTTVHDRISTLVTTNDIVLFMKGTPMFPQCGFSSTAVAILERLGVEFEGVDVLADPEIRAGVKDYSDWPTVPQLYVKGEFVGGSDIMMEMYQAGELTAMIEAAGIARAAA
jgi:monothiol glutaredoxin